MTFALLLIINHLFPIYQRSNQFEYNILLFPTFPVFRSIAQSTVNIKYYRHWIDEVKALSAFHTLSADIVSKPLPLDSTILYKKFKRKNVSTKVYAIYFVLTNRRATPAPWYDGDAN